jgi:YteA family regulatory protein
MQAEYRAIYERLLNEQKNLEQRFQEHDRFGVEESERDSDGELSQYDNHPADIGTTLYEREKDIALAEHEHRHLQDVQAALRRMRDGSYGVCRSCGVKIPIERLEAVPTAITCKRCSEEEGGPRYESERPVEEDVLTGFEQFNFDGDDDETEFDAEDAWQAVSRFNRLPNVHYEEMDDEQDQHED